MTAQIPNAQFGWSMAATRGHNSTRLPEREKERTCGEGEKRERHFGRSGKGSGKGWVKPESRGKESHCGLASQKLRAQRVWVGQGAEKVGARRVFFSFLFQQRTGPNRRDL